MQLYDTFAALAAAVERGDGDACISLREVEVYLRDLAGLEDIGLTVEQRERVTEADTDCYDDRARAVQTLRDLTAQRPGWLPPFCRWAAVAWFGG